MNHEHQTVRAALDIAERIHVEGEELTPDDIGIADITDMTEAITVWRAAQRQSAAAKQVKDAAAMKLAELLGDGGAAAVGDVIVRYRLGRKERCIDKLGALEYASDAIRQDYVPLGDVVNPDYMKRSWMSQAVRDTFYEWYDDEYPRLSETPRDRAPKFLQDLADGDVFTKETDHG